MSEQKRERGRAKWKRENVQGHEMRVMEDWEIEDYGNDCVCASIFASGVWGEQSKIRGIRRWRNHFWAFILVRK
jgi:hypothetical protein